MTAKTLREVLNKANKNYYAVAGLVVLGWEDALAYTQAADETGIPIIYRLVLLVENILLSQY